MFWLCLVLFVCVLRRILVGLVETSFCLEFFVIMSFAKIIRYYLLFTLLRRQQGSPLSEECERIMRRLVAFNLMKKRYAGLRMAARLVMETQRRRRRWHVRPIFAVRKTYGAWYSLIPSLREEDPEEYFRFMRMTPECFDFVLDLVTPFIQKKSQRESLPPGERLAVTLRYLASGDSQHSLSYLFRISHQAISNIVTETTAVIWFVLKGKVFQKLSTEFWRQKAAEFEVMWHFPMCIGAIDGRHCFVQKFPMRGSENYNYKGGHSVVLMAISDAKYKFIMVDVGARGRESDGGVFMRSTFGQMFYEHKLNIPPPAYNDKLGEALPYVFLGDDAFPLHNNLMKPFPNEVASKPEEMVFNYRLSRARRVVENAFGILSARFRILRKAVIASETLAENVILATVALHNLHLQREESIPPQQRVYLPQGFADVFKSNGYVKPGRWRRSVPHFQSMLFQNLARQESQFSEEEITNEEPHIIRELFLELCIADSLPWQYDILN